MGLSQPTAAVQSAVAALRAGGERVTPARRAVLRVLDEASGHLTAEVIAERVDQAEPGVHRATVYRSLQSLADLGVVAHTHVPHGATIYHLRTSPTEAAGHAHLQCVHCERLFDIPPDWLVPLRDRMAAELDLELDVAHAALLGTCADCRES